MIYKCDVCGWKYDEDTGYEGESVKIDPHTLWKNVPQNFRCPLCEVPKQQFSPIIENKSLAE